MYYLSIKPTSLLINDITYITRLSHGMIELKKKKNNKSWQYLLHEFCHSNEFNQVFMLKNTKEL